MVHEHRHKSRHIASPLLLWSRGKAKQLKGDIAAAMPMWAPRKKSTRNIAAQR